MKIMNFLAPISGGILVQVNNNCLQILGITKLVIYPINSSLFLFIDFSFILNALSVDMVLWCRKLLLFVNYKLETTWMETVVVYFKALPQHLVEITEENHEKFGQDNLSLGQLSNSEPNA
jgi:hypothetical protein